jgi:formiminoglutamase
MFEFLQPISYNNIKGDDTYTDGQYGSTILKYTDEEIDWQQADIVMIGVEEKRGLGTPLTNNDTEAIRRRFYELYNWHTHIKIADLGNIQLGKTLNDTYVAMQEVIAELQAAGKTVVIIGGSHDCTLGQCYAYEKQKKIIEVTCVDAGIDLSMESVFRADNFLVEMLTDAPNYVAQYNHIGFQSYFVHPKMMDTLEGLRFDCHRVGKVREFMFDYEPYFRNSHMVSIDLSALQVACMPCNTKTPNGFAGDEACLLAKFAGSSNKLSTFGIYGYEAQHDANEIGATQIAQMLWYFVDGRNSLLKEKKITQKEFFNEYVTAFTDYEITFLQNKENNKWWMKMPDGNTIACTQHDYKQACNNELPEIWLRHHERQF